MVDEHRLSHSNNANNVAKKKEGGGKAARTSPEKEGGRGDAKMGEGENITPRVPVIRTRARDDNAKIPGHRRRFLSSCLPMTRVPSFSRYLHASHDHSFFPSPDHSILRCSFLRPMMLGPPGSCLIFVRSRPLQLSRNLPTAGMVGRREKGKGEGN